MNLTAEQQEAVVRPAGPVGEQAIPAQPRPRRLAKYTRKIVKRALPLVVIGYVSLPALIVLLATGLYDVVRHGRDLAATFHQYFLVNGTLTFYLSPLNALVDLLSLPYINRKIYTLADFPKAYQEEIREITEGCPAEEIIAEVHRRAQADRRTMLIYKWYGFNNPAADSELFQKKFKYILTVGVSTFGKHTKTSRHFGWLRAGIRVLYNIDPAADDGAYIIVNGTRHTWCEDGPLFMFDDTILHQSFNLTDRERHCLFIDVVRPSFVPVLTRGFIKFLGFFWTRLPFITRSSNWRMI
jgi:beta-hydroxylase